MIRRLVVRIVRRWRWIAAAAVVCAAAATWARLGPLPAGLLDEDWRASVVVVDRYGEMLYESRSAAGTRGVELSAGALPARLVEATLAAEDVRFRSHPGIDPIAISRAAWQNLRAGRVVQGGSTISQQVAELLLGRQAGARARRGWMAKAREAIVALRLEHRLTKNELLALYLTLAPYGNQIEGAERASRAYFGRSASTLTAAEAAFLASLPQQPSRFNPWRDPAAARGRQLRILQAMRERGWLTPEMHQVARAERIRLHREAASAVAPHFVERVLAAPQPATAARTIRRIETTLDAALQRTVHGIIAARRGDLDDHRASNVAVAVLDNRTSEWLAWEGSGNYFDTEHGGTIDGVLTPRQPGSALKPFTYAAAFERGYHPGQVLPDVPSQFPTAEPGVLYSPRNYDGQFRGPLAVRAALAGSENVPAVAVASEIGAPAILRLLRRAGVSTLENNAAHYGLGITLGNAEVRLAELMAAYAMLARGGVLVQPRSIRAIDGAPAAPGPEERIVSERTAFWVTDILADNDARAYIFGRGGHLEFPFPVAAKTGTSQSYHDNWAIGYTRDVTVGVWVGNFDRTPLVYSSGVTGAGPLFHDVMLAAVERVKGALPIGDMTPIAMPTADVERRTLCALSGLAPTEACPRRVTEWLPAGDHPPDCTWHRRTGQGVVTSWPQAYQVWARTHEGVVAAGFAPPSVAVATGADDRDPPQGPAKMSPNQIQASAQGPLTIVAPLAGAVYLRDPTLRREFQTLPLRATGGRGPLEWFVNDAPVGRTGDGEALRWPLEAGSHRIAVRDAAGQSSSTRIVVR